MPSNDHIRLFIVDDDREFVDALRDFLETFETFSVVGTTHDPADIPQAAGAEAIDVALVDIRMPSGGGTAAVAHLKALHPDVKILALSAHQDPERRNAMLRSGASQFVLKGGDPGALASTIRTVAT